MQNDISWREGIIQILRSSAEPLHYNKIGSLIFERGLRVNVGATPPRTVNGTIALFRILQPLSSSRFAESDPGYGSGHNGSRLECKRITRCLNQN